MREKGRDNNGERQVENSERQGRLSERKKTRNTRREGETKE